MKNYYNIRIILTMATYPLFIYFLLHLNLSVILIGAIILAFILFTFIFGFVPAIKYFTKIQKDRKFSETIRRSRTWE